MIKNLELIFKFDKFLMNELIKEKITLKEIYDTYLILLIIFFYIIKTGLNFHKFLYNLIQIFIFNPLEFFFVYRADV